MLQMPPWSDPPSPDAKIVTLHPEQTVDGLVELLRATERVRKAREDSDVAYFYDLLNAGEMVVKLATTGLIACIEDDRERHHSHRRPQHRFHPAAARDGRCSDVCNRSGIRHHNST